MSSVTKAVEGLGCDYHKSSAQKADHTREFLTATAEYLVLSGKTANCSEGCVTFRVGQKLAEVEREMIVHTMKMTRGNRTRAAKFLGISVRTLYTKLQAIENKTEFRAVPPS